MAAALVLLAVVVLGLMAGALAAEAAVLVPLWRSQPPASFLAWYRENGHLLLRFYAPLEIAAAVATAAAAAASWGAGLPATAWLGAALLLSLLVLAMFPIYFKRANASFSDGSLDPQRVPDALRRWAAWHGARVLIATAAFVSALLAVRALPPG